MFVVSVEAEDLSVTFIAVVCGRVLKVSAGVLSVALIDVASNRTAHINMLTTDFLIKQHLSFKFTAYQSLILES